MSASLVLSNGRFHTQNPVHPFVTAVAIRDGRILALGDDAAMKSLLAPGGEWLDLHGRTVTPGLMDAHVHFQSYALSLQRVNLAGTTSLDNALRRLAATATADPTADHWLQGRGWAQDEWPDRQFPTAAALDAILPHRPVCLRHKSGHAAWVNSRALRLAGITPTTPDPPGGQIQRDTDGRPTGILFEEAIDLVTTLIPAATVTEIAAAMQQAQERCWRAGLTGLHDFDGRSCFQALQLLHQQGQLGLRIVKNIPLAHLDEAIGVGLRTGFGDEWLRIGGVKLFADGALGSRTAAMLAPYTGEPDNTGIVVTDKETMMACADRASAAGLSLTIHAIGDRANHDVLDVYELLRAAESARPTATSPLRHRIEHVQLLHPQDVPRLAQLGIIASMQPIHATADMDMADQYWGDRARLSYAWRTVAQTGALLALGSDAPVEPIEPLLGLHAAITRCRVNGHPSPAGWYPVQRLSLAEAIHGFTWGTAVAGHQETYLGSLAPGKLADLTIYDQDIFTLSPADLPQATIAATLVAGHFKHRTI